ncbi:MAG: YdeI/OmpD-associated family protein [Chryseolinea sp.]
MIAYNTVIKKFDKKGEKSGWTYITISKSNAHKLLPGRNTTFRIRGTIDSYSFQRVAVFPMGDGSFIFPLNLTIRKVIGKKNGDVVKVGIEADTRKLEPSRDLLASLKDEVPAFEHFKSLSPSHQQYFSNWVESAKTEQTKTRRIVVAVVALSNKLGFGEMIREDRQQRSR